MASILQYMTYFFALLAAKAHCQSTVISLDTQPDTEDIWSFARIIYLESLQDNNSSCNLVAVPPSPSAGFWTACQSGTVGVIRLNLEQLGGIGDAETLSVLAWAQYPAVLEFCIDGAAPCHLVGATNSWSERILFFQDYSRPISSIDIRIVVQRGLAVIDKVEVEFVQRPPTTTTEKPTTTEPAITTTAEPTTTTTEPAITTTAEPTTTTTEPAITTTAEPTTTTTEHAITTTEEPTTTTTEEPEITPTTTEPEITTTTAEEPELTSTTEGELSTPVPNPETTTPEPTPTTTQPYRTTTESGPCPDEGFVQIPHESNCSQYYVCFNGEAILTNCSPYTYFDITPGVERCALAERAVCHAECPNLPGAHNIAVRVRGCKWYKVCRNTQSVNFECQDTLIFSPEERWCVPEENYVCPYA